MSETGNTPAGSTTGTNADSTPTVVFGQEPGWGAQPRPSASRGSAQIRWGGVVWGIILIAFAAGTLAVLSARDRLIAAQAWFASLTPASAWALGLAVAGGIIVVLAVLGGVRSAQRRRRA